MKLQFKTTHSADCVLNSHEWCDVFISTKVSSNLSKATNFKYTGLSTIPSFDAFELLIKENPI